MLILRYSTETGDTNQGEARSQGGEGEVREARSQDAQETSREAQEEGEAQQAPQLLSLKAAVGQAYRKWIRCTGGYGARCAPGRLEKSGGPREAERRCARKCHRHTHNPPKDDRLTYSNSGPAAPLLHGIMIDRRRDVVGGYMCPVYCVHIG